ncbi:MAG: chromosome segregation protein SMC [Candidatus Nanopelagicales bacterium]
MYLKSLTAKGFKSFASSTTLEFEPGITCVVGPNGSGKSNVVDAIAWVMGEQGAKTLRGGKMDDVIFAGTSGRGALGRAEVSLTIDNTDGALPIDYTEVTISRTLFRSGGSEYAINGQQCRLLDIQELLSDSGIGREMHVIVGQGRLDAILHATPEDRRGFIEEAAGVLKHRKRKEKALRKLDAMSANLTRVQDLTAELRRQLKPLGRQAEVARRAQVIQADVRDARLRLLADDLHQALTKLNDDEAHEAQIRERQATAEKDLEAAITKEQEIQQYLEAHAPKTNEANELHVRFTALREQFIGLTNLAMERTRIAEESTGEQLTIDPEQLDLQAAKAREDQEQAAAEVTVASQALEAASQARADAEAALAEAREHEAELNRQIAERRERKVTLEAEEKSARSRVESKESELERISLQLADAHERRDSLARELDQIEGDAPVDQAQLDDQLQAMAQAEARVEELTGALDSSRDALNAARKQEASLKARIEALELSNVTTSGIDSLNSSAAQVVGLVSEHVRVREGYERAIEAALAHVLGDETIALTSIDDAVAALRHLGQTDAGRTSMMIVNAHSSPPHPDAAPYGSQWATEVVTLTGDQIGGLSQSVTSALSGIAIVEDLDAAAAALGSSPSLTIVTRGGDVLSRDRATGGQPALSRIELANTLDRARSELTEASREAERFEAESNRLAGELEAAKSTLEQASETIEATTGLRREHSQRLNVLAAKKSSVDDEVTRLAEAEAQGREQVRVVREQSEQAIQALAQFVQELEAHPQAEVSQEPVEEARQELAKARQVEVDSQLEVRSAQERAAAHERRAAELNAAAEAEREARQAAIKLREKRRKQAEIATQVLEVANLCSGVINESLRETSAQREQLILAREESDRELRDVRANLDQIRQTLSELTNAAHQDDLARAEQHAKIGQIQEKALEEYGIESDDLVAEYGPDVLVPPSLRAPGDEIPEGEPEPEAYPFVRDEQEKRLKVAEKSMALLGKVNPLALEEFAAMEERHTFLTAQLDDLKRGRDDLLDIVSDVDARVEQVFSEAFADVQREFETVFATLFPGGEGRLVLTDPSDLLTTGIEVEARPAGKRVKRLSLLSGGERSLTAVAFLVSLFKARPSPFYLLDEVEAALDDVNLGRLIGLLEQLRDTSQLLVITHQKKTMEIADALYGVTMKDGITQVISQRIRELVPA